MPASVIKMKAGKHIPTSASVAPSQPARRSPARIAMFVALSPGRVLLIDVISKNSTSSNHRFFRTNPSRKYATTPPPKLMAPISKNVRKIVRTDGFGLLWGLTAASLMALRRISLETIDESGLRRAEVEPTRCNELQFDEELLDALFGDLVNGFAPVESGLIGELAAHYFVVAERAPERDVALGDDPFAEAQRPQIHQHLLDERRVDELDSPFVGAD